MLGPIASSCQSEDSCMKDSVKHDLRQLLADGDAVEPEQHNYWKTFAVGNGGAWGLMLANMDVSQTPPFRRACMQAPLVCQCSAQR